ncbi:MAG: ATP/GTP-binding protein [Nitrososphaerota archaeon]|nr:ATP/GTP-binding protein [Candidatus Bathyarchaeota archaeon]MDW8062329.1 ATP/GTP-binding protein [Nitrososphaerota archaeon]
MYILFIGTAGSGKSSLTYSFGSWLEKEIEASVGYVNLDPGCMHTPFKPDFDIRSLFTVDDLMRKERLGPNGAIIKAAELMKEYSGIIALEISKIKSEFTLIDTPGQMEIFVFRDTGPVIAETLRRIGRILAAYIFDPILAKTASDLSVALSLAVATQIRLGIPCVSILNKSDLPEAEAVLTLLNYPEKFIDRITKERLGVSTDIALALANLAQRYSKHIGNVIPVSAKTGIGLDRLYDICREVFCVCGEL